MKKQALTLALCLFTSSAFATSCPQHYFSGQEPGLTIPLQQNREICYTVFATGYSDATRTAFYSAEHLIKKNVLSAKKLKREDSFHEDPNLPESAQAKLTDYKGSGFDRGHLAPNADMPTKQAQYESFSLANMVPQLHVNNAGIWSEIESTVRNMATTYGDVYVVTGGLYNASTQKIKNRIPVPNALFKAVYVPKMKEAGVFISDNNSSGSYKVISVNQLKKLSGIDVFPSLPNQKKELAMELPEVKQKDHKPAKFTLKNLLGK
jgi:DNA/RNA endonuclease G, NUC1